MYVCCCVNKATSEDSKPEHPRKENVFQVQTYHCLLPFHTCPHLLHKHISLFLLNTLHIYFPMLSTPKTSAQQLDQLLHSHSNALLDCIVAIYKDAKALPEIPPFLKQCMSDLFFFTFLFTLWTNEMIKLNLFTMTLLDYESTRMTLNIYVL